METTPDRSDLEIDYVDAIQKSMVHGESLASVLQWMCFIVGEQQSKLHKHNVLDRKDYDSILKNLQTAYNRAQRAGL
jgi:hypothetical protein